MSRVWVFQEPKTLEKLGADACPWSVGWYDPAGKRKQKKLGSRSMAEKHARKVEGQLAAGVYSGDSRKQWKDFRAEYEEKILPRLATGSARAYAASLDHFQKLICPSRLDTIKTQTIDDFITRRKALRGKAVDSKTTSPATINKDLRNIKAALRVAHDWGYLPTVPKFRMVREPEKLPRYVLPDHFAAIYKACDTAELPASKSYTAADWWKALLCFAYMTGWRIGQILALKRADVDLDKATAITRAESNKGKRDAMIPLAPVVVDHLKKIPAFGPLMFAWPECERKLWATFHAIEAAATIDGKPLGLERPYGFHDIRRAFATMNADRMSETALQALMQHKSFLTTKKYINMARQLNPAVEALHVPDVLRKAT